MPDYEPDIPAAEGVAAPPAPVQVERDGDLDELLSFITHELMTPVAIVNGFATTLRKRLGQLEPERARELAAHLERSARHLGELITSFADVRAIESDQLALQPAHVDLAELVRETVADLATVTGSRPVSLDVAASGAVEADPVRLRQVLTNLVSNAAKFSGSTAPVEIGLRRRGDRLELWVRDHGPGIPLERRGELFGKFSRLGSRARGMGLGLYLSRGIARAHGGDLVCEDAEGGGARFVLSVPVQALDREHVGASLE